jgi:hypothetical protein
MFEPATFLKTSHISGILFWVTDWNFGNHDPIILTSLPQVFWHFYVLIFKEHQTMAGASLLWVLRNNVWNQVAEFLCHIHIEATNIISVGFLGGEGAGLTSAFNDWAVLWFDLGHLRFFVEAKQQKLAETAYVCMFLAVLWLSEALNCWN